MWLICPDVRKLSDIPAHRQVTRLAVETEHPLALDVLRAWPALTSLELSGTHASLDTLADLRAHPRITRLELTAFPWGSQAAVPVDVPSVTDLTVPSPPHGEDLASVRHSFPALSHLVLLVPDTTEVLDLTTLHAWHDLQVTIARPHVPKLVGAAELGERLKIDTS